MATRTTRRDAAADQTDDTPVSPPVAENPTDQTAGAQGDAEPPADETTAETPEVDAAGDAQDEPGEPADPIDTLVDAWFSGFNDSPLSRNAELWSLVQSRLPALKSAVREV